MSLSISLAMKGEMRKGYGIEGIWGVGEKAWLECINADKQERGRGIRLRRERG